MSARKKTFKTVSHFRHRSLSPGPVAGFQDVEGLDHKTTSQPGSQDYDQVQVPGTADTVMVDMASGNSTGHLVEFEPIEETVHGMIEQANVRDKSVQWNPYTGQVSEAKNFTTFNGLSS